MQYIIDGHNLIPKLGMHLDSQDDELQLITRLQEFCRIRRAQVEVFFDGAPAGQAGTRSAGSVKAHFVRKSSIADTAIENRLGQLGRAARNWTVVSSDARVQTAARAVHATVLSSDEFARLFSAAQAEGMPGIKTDGSITPAEVDEWLRTFRGRG